jgi:N utilization substance protein A
MKGVRIQAIVRELEGEKIDILKYDMDPRTFIKNALSPADVQNVIILDESKRQALAVVEESQLSLAIGKQGLNVRLANRLVDWNIDVKTEEQFDEMDISVEAKRAVHALFGEIDEQEEITDVAELPGLTDEQLEVLGKNNIVLIEDLVALSQEELEGIDGLTSEDVTSIQATIADNVDIIEEEVGEAQEEEIPPEEEEEEEEEEEIEQASSETPEITETTEYVEQEEVEEYEYECPDCGASITIDMTTCPNCGVGLSFEIEEEGESSGETV